VGNIKVPLIIPKTPLKIFKDVLEKCLGRGKACNEKTSPRNYKSFGGRCQHKIISHSDQLTPVVKIN
jgi:hypothetical protein